MRKTIPVNEKGRRIGEGHPRSTISDSTVFLLRELHEESGKSYGYLSLKFKIPRNTIAKICRYERRADIPHKWKRGDHGSSC